MGYTMNLSLQRYIHTHIIVLVIIVLLSLYTNGSFNPLNWNFSLMELNEKFTVTSYMYIRFFLKYFFQFNSVGETIRTEENYVMQKPRN